VTLTPANGVTLADRFIEYRNGLIHDWMKILAVLGVALIPLFLLLDYVTMPSELLRRFAVYRGVTTAATAVQFLVLRASKPSPLSFVHGYIFSLLVCGMIVLMTVDLGGFSSAYYAGLMLVIFPVNVLLPWRSVHAAINALLAVGLYIIANVLFGGDSSAANVVNNLYFLLSTVVLVVAMSETRYRLIQQEFNLRAQLEDTNVTLETSRSDLKKARDRLWSEMEVAQRIQTALLPKNRRLGPYEAEAVMRPAEEVGGDYYDFLETRHKEHWVAIGDVSGHGVESGLVMMMTQTTIATLVNDLPNRKPSDVISFTNQVIRENVSRLGGTRYMTLNVIRLEKDRLIIAGKHQDVFVWRAAHDRVETVSNPGTWIGVVDDVRPATEDVEIKVGVGDWVLLYTDGITEATNGRGEMFGDDRLRKAFARVAGKVTLPRAVAELLDEVKAFAGALADDETVVLLRRVE
jgi:sigma-B regulation protein RsbU (phosphoserine phosphatase)